LEGSAINLDIAYKNCIRFASDHYENFPVISLFVQKNLRKHVAVIYCFARYADDIADEGDDTPEVRLDNLKAYRDKFHSAIIGKYENEFWAALHNSIIEYNLDISLFESLLKAFEQDIFVNRFEKFDDILRYCSNSANPIGRIILRLYGINNLQMDILSDKICSGLQLTNFYQDVSIDLKKNRIYFPLEELKEFNVQENDFFENRFNDQMKSLIKYQVGRNREFFNQGKIILEKLPARLKIQIGLTINGGEKILSKLEQLDYNVLKFRPALTKFDILSIFLKTFFYE